MGESEEWGKFEMLSFVTLGEGGGRGGGGPERSNSVKSDCCVVFLSFCAFLQLQVGGGSVTS